MIDDMQYPPYLVTGDKVAIISPAGKIDKNFLAGARKRLESWGLIVQMGKYAGGSSGRFAGTVKQRLSDLQRAMDNPEIKAIFCSRGGYGAIHLIDKVDFTAFRQHPKWLLGYSDITLLHELFQFNGYASIHSLMARHLTVEDAEDPCTLHLKELLFGNPPTYTYAENKFNRKGKAQGLLRGGNLSVLYGLRGTPFDLSPEGTILFIEDIGEQPYHIDRMMNNLRIGGVLEKLSGLIVGQFTETGEGKAMKEVYELIAELVKPYSYPVCFDFPVGHVTLNYPLICGAKVELEVNKKQVSLKTLRKDEQE